MQLLERLSLISKAGLSDNDEVTIKVGDLRKGVLGIFNDGIKIGETRSLERTDR